MPQHEAFTTQGHSGTSPLHSPARSVASDRSCRSAPSPTVRSPPTKMLRPRSALPVNHSPHWRHVPKVERLPFSPHAALARHRPPPTRAEVEARAPFTAAAAVHRAAPGLSRPLAAERGGAPQHVERGEAPRHVERGEAPRHVERGEAPRHVVIAWGRRPGAEPPIKEYFNAETAKVEHEEEMSQLREKLASWEDAETEWWKWYSGEKKVADERAKKELDEQRDEELRETLRRDRERREMLERQKEEAHKRKVQAREVLQEIEKRMREEKEARMEEERKQAEQKMRMASLRKRASSRKVMGFVNS
ncbi:hypothetical protein AB1Y20_018716 [Prymnesium parvum]|uniref:Uncharacterized protein n=1 Tax=Prymnesium parvum TaxID=97485 RepID=A0AB34JSK2_PRYPA